MENLKLEIYNLSTINGIESKESKLIQRNSDYNRDSGLEMEIEKCDEILTLEEKDENNSIVDDIFIEVIETNEFGNQVKNFPEFTISDSSSDSESFQTLPKFVGVKKDQSKQPTPLTSETHKHMLKNSHSPERKKIKLLSDEFPFDSKLKTSIQTKNQNYENISKNKLILLNGVDLIPNKSLNEKTQINYKFSDSVKNVNSTVTNFSTNNNLFDFTLQDNNNTLMENNELKAKSLFKHLGKTFINSEGEIETRRESCETNYSGDTLILDYGESDIDSEIERCNELLNQSCNDNLEKDNIKIQGNTLNNTNETLSLNIKCGTEIVDSAQLSNGESDIESEMEKCSQLLNISGVSYQIMASDDNSQNSDDSFYLESSENSQTSCDNLIYLENNNEETEDIKITTETNNYEENSKFETIAFTLKNNYQLKTEQNTDPKTVTLNKITENETRENSDIQKFVTLNKTSKNEIRENFEIQNTVALNEIFENETEDYKIPNIVDLNISKNETPGNSEIPNIFTSNEIVKNETQEGSEIQNISKNESQKISEIQNVISLNEIVKNETQENTEIQNIVTSTEIVKKETQENSEIQNIFTLSKIVKKEIKENTEIQNIVVDEFFKNEAKENSEPENIVNLNNKSPKEIEIDKKILFTNITPQKHRPERIFKLAIKSINEISIDNSNSASKISNDSPDKNNNSFPSTKLNDKEFSKEEPVKDYFEDEKEDITNPEWQAVKNLSTNEERYQQVRKCWKSRSVPDPNKNLTYHSYRKRLFSSDNGQKRSIKQHKRHASSSLPGRDAKRPCTFFLDKEIDSIKRTQDIQTQEIINEMHNKIGSVEVGCFSRQHIRGNDFYRPSYALDRINNRVSIITDEYRKIVSDCENLFSDKILALNERRNEVLKFYRFYQGLNDSSEDPTLLTDSQFQELDEIENIYEQFNHYYGGEMNN